MLPLLPRVGSWARPTFGSSTKYHEIGTIANAGSARMAQTALKDKPLSNVPLYSRPFIPTPTRSLAQIIPISRVR